MGGGSVRFVWGPSESLPVSTNRRRRFVHAHLAWTCASIVLLAALDALSLELAFVCSLIGFLVVVELTAPVNVTPQWRSRLKWLVAAGLVVFAAIVVRRILAILPPEVI